MLDRKIKIVVDSSSDLLELNGFLFESVPLQIVTAEKRYVDSCELDVEQMVNDLGSYKGRSSTSCPNANDYLSAFEGADDIFCITITGTLSGSYNAAVLAARQYEEQHPGSRVFVHNSLSTGPEMVLAVDKACELIRRGDDFDAICGAVTDYAKHTGLIFMLQSMKNLANNGRVSPVVAKLAGLLGIRVVGKASDRGDLEPIRKVRGEKNALEQIVSSMKSEGYRGGGVYISHCINEGAAAELKRLIADGFPSANIKIYPCRGLCSFYAERGGLLIGFEK